MFKTMIKALQKLTELSAFLGKYQTTNTASPIKIPHNSIKIITNQNSTKVHYVGLVMYLSIF